MPGEVGNVFNKDWEKTALLPVTLCDLVLLVGSVRYNGAYCQIIARNEVDRPAFCKALRRVGHTMAVCAKVNSPAERLTASAAFNVLQKLGSVPSKDSM